MNFRRLVYASDNRLRIVWRILIFIGLLLIAVSPLILIENATLQFLGATAILISGLYLSAQYLDQRPFSKYGLKFTKRSFHYCTVGILMGAVSVGFILIIGNLIGAISISRYPTNPDVSYSLLFGLKMILVATIEKSLYRGYFFTDLYEVFQTSTYSNKLALITAVGVSSLLFGLAHFSNDNASIISISFLTVNGIVWCVPFIMTNNLGLSIGLHASWNFFQSFLGFIMSGNKADDSMFNIKNIGNPIWTGGDYGPEAGLLGLLGFVTMLLLTLTYVGVLANQRQQ